jgi:hypothetical protein
MSCEVWGVKFEVQSVMHLSSTSKGWYTAAEE